MALRDPRLGGTEIIALREGVVSTLQQRWPVDQGIIKTIESFRGKWDAARIRKYGRRAPALIVSINATEEAMLSGEHVQVAVAMSIGVMTRTDDGPADDACIALITALLRLLPSNDFDVECVSGAEEVVSKNLFSETIEGTAMNLWGVAWMSTVRLPLLTDEQRAELDDWLRTRITYDPQPSGPADAKPVQEIDQS